MEREWELRLTTGKTAVWSGETGEDAARRYVDAHRDAVVIAYRNYPRHGLFAGVDPRQIVG